MILKIFKTHVKDIYEMARVGFTSDSFEVYVNTNDSGDTPHFHYRYKVGVNFTNVFG